MDYPKIFLTAWFSLVSLTAFCEPLPSGDPCDFEVITESCKVFDPGGPEKIILSDGSTMFNFVAMSQNESDKYFKAALIRKIAAEEKNSPEFLRVRQKLIELFNDVSSKKMSPKFKFYITNNFVEFIELLFDESRANKREIEIPWPPEIAETEKTVSLKEVVAKFGALMNPEQMEQIQSIYNEMKILQGTAKRFSAAKYNEELMKKVSPGKLSMVTKYFEFSKTRIIALISNGLSQENLTQADEALVRKVRTVKLAQFDSNSEDSREACQGGIPNAFYDSRYHSVTLCPATFFLSDTAIIQIIAHEIGHSISPCNSQFGTYEISSDKLIKAQRGIAGGAYREIGRDPNKRKMLMELLSINKKSNTTAFHLSLIANENVVQYFISKDILKPEIPGVKYDKYSFRNVVQCLSEKHGFRGVDEKEVRRIATEVSRARAEYREPSYNPQVDERQIVDVIMKYPECVSAGKKSQADEALADWFSSKVLADYLTGNPLKNSQERLGMVSFLAALVCQQRYEGQKQDYESNASVFESINKDSSSFRESHPPSKRRIEKIIFGEPQIRKSAGCPMSREIACQR